jgi:hypothetical protein
MLGDCPRKGAPVPVIAGRTRSTLTPVLVPRLRRQGVLAELGRARAGQAGHHGFQSRTPRVLASYICKACEIEGQDLEASPGRVFCWNCEDEAMITARIVEAGLARRELARTGVGAGLGLPA